jgi:hypothetical protein
MFQQGVAMLSRVLKCQRAIAVNVEIMRAFVRLRQLLATRFSPDRQDGMTLKERSTGRSIAVI